MVTDSGHSRVRLIPYNNEMKNCAVNICKFKLLPKITQSEVTVDRSARSEQNAPDMKHKSGLPEL